MQRFFIGDNLRDLRRERRLSQVELAQLSHLRQSFISDLETNQKEPGAGSLVSLAKALEVPVDVLLFGTGISEPPVKSQD